MAEYSISGVWKDVTGTITHYAIHASNSTTVFKGTKYSKAEAVALLSKPENTAETIIWNYENANWKVGAMIEVEGLGVNRYLRTRRDKTVRDNLDNLINYGWITDDFE